MSLRPTLLRSSLTVGFFALLGSLTGILVETSIAAKLGLSRSSDAFYVALTVPYIISNLLSATGQFSLVPFFTTLEARHSAEELWRGFSYAVNVIFLGLSALAVVGAAAAPWVTRAIAPGLTRAQADLATQLSQWLFLMIIPAGLVEVFRSFLLSQRRFALPSAAGFFRNIAVVALVLLTFDRYGAYSIVLGYLAGYFLQLCILGAQVLISFPVRYSLVLVGTGEAFRNLRGAGAAQLTAAAAWQFVVIVERIIASFLPPGTLTALNYGFKILTTLAELLAGSVGTAGLGPLSQAIAAKATSQAQRIFQIMLETTLVLVSPVTVFCLLLHRNIIRLVFQRGNFTPDATATMSTVFFYYALSLVAYATIRTVTFYLFARHERVRFVRLAFLHCGLTVAFDLFYVGILRLGALGIPLGLLTSLSVTAVVAFRQDLPELRNALDRSLGIFALKNLLASALTGVALWLLPSWLEPPQAELDNFVYLWKMCGAGTLVFFAVLAALRALRASEFTAVFQPGAD